MMGQKVPCRQSRRAALSMLVPLCSVMAALSIPVLTVQVSEALPQYTARGGRSCTNCHTDPAEWENPGWWDRVCTMSCSGCHIDPTGGGLRSASGIYYGVNALPMFGATQPVFSRLGWWADMSESDREAYGQLLEHPNEDTDGPSVPLGWIPNTGDTESSLFSWGTPVGPRATNRLHEGRYAGLEPDPIFQLGGDSRIAAYLQGGSPLIFPMQFEIAAALHPIDHLTVYMEGALWGSVAKDDEPGGEEVDFVGFHEAFVMSNEWPGNAYLKVGRFLPPYGTRLDDHTAPVRRALGFDPGRPSSYVSGVEIGMAPNYPYLNLAVFQTGLSQHALTGQGEWAFSGMGGWRDMGWGIGAQGYHQGADSDGDGRLMLGGSLTLNPWYYWARVPLTYMAELNWVALSGQPAGSAPDRTINQLAAFQELDWVIIQGLAARLRHDYWDPDLEVVDDHVNRLTLHFDVLPYRYIELQLLGRLQMPAYTGVSMDFMVVLHFWL